MSSTGQVRHQNPKSPRRSLEGGKGVHPMASCRFFFSFSNCTHVHAQSPFLPPGSLYTSALAPSLGFTVTTCAGRTAPDSCTDFWGDAVIPAENCWFGRGPIQTSWPGNYLSLIHI